MSNEERLFIGTPIILFAVIGWIGEATIVSPTAKRLRDGERLSAQSRRGDCTATTRPRGA